MGNKIIAFILACSIFGSLSIKSMEEPPDRKRSAREADVQEHEKKPKIEEPQGMELIPTDAAPSAKALLTAAATRAVNGVQAATPQLQNGGTIKCIYINPHDFRHATPLWLAAANGHTTVKFFNLFYQLNTCFLQKSETQVTSRIFDWNRLDP